VIAVTNARAQKMRTGAFTVSSAAASPRAIVEACVRAVQPAVTVPIQFVLKNGTPEAVRYGHRRPAPLLALVSQVFFVLYCIVLYCIVLYCIVLYCIVLYCIVLYCIVLVAVMVVVVAELVPVGGDDLCIRCCGWVVAGAARRLCSS
jgi:hypothetical protein